MLRKWAGAAIIGIFTPLLLWGCGPRQIPKDLYTQKAVGRFQLHGGLEKTSSGYRFTELSTRRFHLKGTHVYINDLSPEDLDVESYSCLDRFFGLVNARNCPESREGNFRSKSIILGDTIGMHLYYAGLLTVFGVVPIVHESHFDYMDYNEAVAEALKNWNLDRKSLLDKLEEGITYCHQLGKDLQAYGKGKYDEEHYYATSLYNRFRERINVVEKVRDSSGFYDNSIALMNQVTIAANAIPTKQVEPFYYPLDVSCPPERFNAEIDRSKRACDASYAEDRDEINRSVMQYSDALAKLTSFVYLRHPKEFTQNDYHVRVSAPDTVKCGEETAVPVEFEILSKDFRSVYPRFREKDNNLEVTFDGRFLTFTNKTKKRVKIRAVLLQYNNETLDIAANDLEATLELLPGAVISGYDINERINEAIFRLSNYPRLTSTIAQQTTIDFGFAIKYRIIDQTGEKTLTKTQKYNLYEVVKSAS